VDWLRDFQGRTALFWACRNGHVPCARVLCDAGARLRARDGYGATPLHEAARHGRAGAVQWLLARGAPAGATDGAGRTPEEATSHPEVIWHLRQHAASAASAAARAAAQ
jgi:ankyrin repeat protein